MLNNTLLLTCRSDFLDDDKVYPPLVTMYLKSWIKREIPEATVEINDEYDLEDPDFWKGHDLIGVSVMTPQKDEARKIFEAIKKHNPTARTMIGGPHVKFYYDELIQEQPGWDHYCKGDGEEVLVEIIKTGKAEKVSQRALTKDQILNAPAPDRLSEDSRMILSRYHYTLNGRKATTFMSARGCPNRCGFCEDAGTMVRWSGMDSIRKQLDDIKSLGYGGVYVFDDTFALSPALTEPITKFMKERDLIFRCNAQAKFFTMQGEKFAEILARDGCVELAFGFESGSQKMLDACSKGTTTEQNRLAAKYAKKHGIKIKGFIILGLPGENWETLKETEKFIAETQMDDFQCAVYMPYKGTSIRSRMDAGEDIDLQMTVKEVSGAYGIKGGETAYEVRTKVLSAKDLEKFRNYLVDKYRPKSHGGRWKK